MINKDKELREFYARLDDMRELSDRGEIGISQFLTEAERARADSYLKRCAISYLFFGGYGEAERTRLYILPDYMEGEGVDVLEDYGYSSQIKALTVRGSGYSRLTHRDFLGSLLSLGIERAVIGDIAVAEDGRSAVIFCDERILPFILTALERVGGDKVSLRTQDVREIDESSLPTRRFASINTTVSSARLDCIVSSLCNLSREKASELISAGSVEVDFEIEQRPDRKLTPPCVASVRGFGKYRVLSVDTPTKKGRYRLEAKKYL